MTEVELKAKQLVNYYHENLDGLYIEAREVTAIKFAIYHVEEMLSQFKQLFEQATGILEYAIESKNNEFVLHALRSNADKIAEFVHSSNATVFVVYHTELNTNGGIKNIS